MSMENAAFVALVPLLMSESSSRPLFSGLSYLHAFLVQVPCTWVMFDCRAAISGGLLKLRKRVGFHCLKVKSEDDDNMISASASQRAEQQQT